MWPFPGPAHAGMTGNNRRCATIGPVVTRTRSALESHMTEQVDTAQEIRTDGINLSATAASKVKSLLEQEGRDDLQLRIAVQPGGCSGLRYQLFFDERNLDGDLVTDFDGVAVVVDRMSSPYLNGAVIDFVDTIEKQGFTIDNPNATGSCACGDSFHGAAGGALAAKPPAALRATGVFASQGAVSDPPDRPAEWGSRCGRC